MLLLGYEVKVTHVGFHFGTAEDSGGTAAEVGREAAVREAIPARAELGLDATEEAVE